MKPLFKSRYISLKNVFLYPLKLLVIVKYSVIAEYGKFKFSGSKQIYTQGRGERSDYLERPLYTANTRRGAKVI